MAVRVGRAVVSVLTGRNRFFLQGRAPPSAAELWSTPPQLLRPSRPAAPSHRRSSPPVHSPAKQGCSLNLPPPRKGSEEAPFPLRRLFSKSFSTHSPPSLLLASVNKGKQRRPAAAKPRLPRSRPRLAAASLRPVALQTCPCGAGAVLWSFGAMPGPLARQTTTPPLPEGEEDNAGRGPRHCPQNRCCPCSPML